MRGICQLSIFPSHDSNAYPFIVVLIALVIFCLPSRIHHLWCLLATEVGKEESSNRDQQGKGATRNNTLEIGMEGGKHHGDQNGQNQHSVLAEGGECRVGAGECEVSNTRRWSRRGQGRDKIG